jgi:hypothetical protein
VLFITDPEEGAALSSRAAAGTVRVNAGRDPAIHRPSQGKSVEEYAHEAGISSNTARM